MEMIDICFVLRDKTGWIADCHEAGYSKDELIKLEEWDDYFTSIERDADQFVKNDFENLNVEITEFKKERNMKYPELDKDLKDHEIKQAREYPLFKLLKVKRGERIPCPFHNGMDKNFVIQETGHCFVCKKTINSIGWLIEKKFMKFPDSVRALL